MSETLRTANDSITRVMPLKIMLTPTSVPIAHGQEFTRHEWTGYLSSR